MLEVRGLNEFTEDLKSIIRQYPNAAEEKLIDLGGKLKQKAILKTPKKTGKLRRGYKLSQVKQVGDTIYIEFSNGNKTFHLIEKGHRKVTIKRGEDGRKIEIEHGFQEGEHMVENSTIEMDAEMPQEISAWLDKLLKELD